MAKYYAVRNGFHIGIFNTWEECRKEVSGYSGAEYKSFTSLADARSYMGVNEQISLFEEGKPESSTAVAYVDGSYNVETKRFGCGVVIFYGGEEFTFSRAFDNAELASMRNVAGEIEGAKLAMQWCVDNNIEEIDIYYDYEGVEKWCTGAWKTNKSGTIAYKQFYDSLSGRVKVSFNKVKGHSGDRFNDMADMLAKKAVGIE
jgi:ribonuclease HI